MTGKSAKRSTSRAAKVTLAKTAPASTGKELDSVWGLQAPSVAPRKVTADLSTPKRRGKSRKTVWQTFGALSNLERQRLAHLHRLFSDEIGALAQRSIAALLQASGPTRSEVSMDTLRGLRRALLADRSLESPDYFWFRPAGDPNLVDLVSHLAERDVVATMKRSLPTAIALELARLVQALSYLSFAHLNVALHLEREVLGRPPKSANRLDAKSTPDTPRAPASATATAMAVNDSDLVDSVDGKVSVGMTVAAAVRLHLEQRGRLSPSPKKLGANGSLVSATRMRYLRAKAKINAPKVARSPKK